MPTQFTKERIGSRLKTARLATGFSQEEVAKQFGLTRQAVAAWESGASCPTAVQLAKLCSTYGCSSDLILFGVTAYDLGTDITATLDVLPPEAKSKVRLLWQIFGRHGADTPWASSR